MNRKFWKQMVKLLPENYWTKLLDFFFFLNGEFNVSYKEILCIVSIS